MLNYQRVSFWSFGAWSEFKTPWNPSAIQSVQVWNGSASIPKGSPGSQRGFFGRPLCDVYSFFFGFQVPETYRFFIQMPWRDFDQWFNDGRLVWFIFYSRLYGYDYVIIYSSHPYLFVVIHGYLWLSLLIYGYLCFIISLVSLILNSLCPSVTIRR